LLFAVLQTPSVISISGWSPAESTTIDVAHDVPKKQIQIRRKNLITFFIIPPWC